MKASVASTLLGTSAVLLAGYTTAHPAIKVEKRDVDTRYNYTGPEVPIGDWVDPTINGNGKGFPRLVEPPAVKPASDKPTNNVNVIAVAYVPGGINIHYQTPFGLGVPPSVQWGPSPLSLPFTRAGTTHA